MAGFQVYINGRFWVSTEGLVAKLERNSLGRVLREGRRSGGSQQQEKAAKNGRTIMKTLVHIRSVFDQQLVPFPLLPAIPQSTFCRRRKRSREATRHR